MFIFDPDMIYNMPPYFGGHPYDATAASVADDMTQMHFTYLTDEKLLNNYLPCCFHLLRPEMTLSYSQLRGVDFLVGSHYNIAQLSIPVVFSGMKDYIQGSFILVLWENNTRPIIGGREETGMPKIEADIEDIRYHQGEYSGVVSLHGNTFLTVNLTDCIPEETSDLEKTQESNRQINAFGWRYIPKVGCAGAEISQPILYPQSVEVKQSWKGKGSFEWTVLTPKQTVFQSHIIKALSELPVYKMIGAGMVKGRVVMRPSRAKVLE